METTQNLNTIGTFRELTWQRKQERKMIDYQKIANSVARKNGYGFATEILFGFVKSPKVLSHTRYGHRKKTTGQYVPNAYLSKFGWKNTYYQAAQTTVLLPISLVDWSEE